MGILNKLLKNAKVNTFLRDFFTDEEWETSKVLSIISAEIEFERYNRGMTQKEFAKFIGVSRRKIARWEKCEYNFTIKELAHIAAKLDRTVKSIMFGKE